MLISPRWNALFIAFIPGEARASDKESRLSEIRHDGVTNGNRSAKSPSTAEYSLSLSLSLSLFVFRRKQRNRAPTQARARSSRGRGSESGLWIAGRRRWRSGASRRSEPTIVESVVSSTTSTLALRNFLFRCKDRIDHGEKVTARAGMLPLRLCSASVTCSYIRFL